MEYPSNSNEDIGIFHMHLDRKHAIGPDILRSLSALQQELGHNRIVSGLLERSPWSPAYTSQVLIAPSIPLLSPA